MKATAVSCLLFIISSGAGSNGSFNAGWGNDQLQGYTGGLRATNMQSNIPQWAAGPLRDHRVPAPVPSNPDNITGLGGHYMTSNTPQSGRGFNYATEGSENFAVPAPVLDPGLLVAMGVPSPMATSEKWWDVPFQASIPTIPVSPSPYVNQQMSDPSDVVSQKHTILTTTTQGKPDTGGNILDERLYNVNKSWRESSTGRSAHQFLEALEALIQRNNHFGSSEEFFVPLQNFKNVITELSLLTSRVVSGCEEERVAQNTTPHYAHAVIPIFRSGGPPEFPAQSIITKADDYVRVMTEALLGCRDFLRLSLGGYVAPSELKPHIEKLKAILTRAKSLQGVSSQLINAIMAAIIPHISSCSFFTSGNGRRTQKHWSLVGARIKSVGKYMMSTTELVRKVGMASLWAAVIGKVQNQSVEDYARSKIFFKVDAYVRKAQSRSVSSVQHLNKLAAVYDEYTRKPKDMSSSSSSNLPFTPTPKNVPDKYTEIQSLDQSDDDEHDSHEENKMENDVMSLMAEDLGMDLSGSPGGIKSTGGMDGEEYSMNMGMEESMNHDYMQTVEDD